MLCQELQMLGLPGILTKESRQPETSRMVNVLFHLLQLHRHNLNAIDKLKDRYIIYTHTIHRPLLISQLAERKE